MPAAGSGRHNYNFTDMVLDIPATYYYQLKLVDMDGRYKYSSITYINNKHVGKTLDIFHNPATDFITIVSNKMQLSALSPIRQVRSSGIYC